MSQNIPIELGTQSVKKLLRQYALPAIIAMTASSLYNMVDSIYIGQGVGNMAISGLAVTFPLMNISAAFGTLVGVGGAALVSMLLGQKNYTVARKVLGNVMTLNVFVGLLITVVGLLFINPILYFFGASENTIFYAREYMTIILVGNIVTHLYFGLNAMMRSSGHPRTAMWATILTVVLNAILDPIFIFVLDMGIRGAAIATIIAQVVSLVWLLMLFSRKNEVLHFERRVFTLDWKIAKESIAIGLAPFLMNLASCFVVILINNRLHKYGSELEVDGGGDLAIGAYGIINRIAFLFVMIVMGFTQGMQPIVGYNYGAGQYDRVTTALWRTIMWATIVTTTGFLIGMLCPRIAVAAFTSDPTLIDLAAKGLTITLAVFPIVGMQMVASNFFQSIGMPSRAIFLSLSRQVLFLIPCLIVLPLFFGLEGVWISMPVSDTVATVVAVVMLVDIAKRFKRSPQTIGFKGIDDKTEQL